MNVQEERGQMAARDILGPDGPFAKALPGYEPRAAQIEMAELVQRAIATRSTALIEAGTGTGKSYGYLVPAILSGRRCIVSTDTIALQQQLVEKDLPRLATLLAPAIGRELTYAIAVGKSNYFCIRNAQPEPERRELIPDSEVQPAQPRWKTEVAETAAALLALRAGGTWDGTRSTVPASIQADAHWRDLAADDTCTGKKCRFAEDCALMRAKARLGEADVVVANHTIFLIDQMLQQSGIPVSILPASDVWIADEAHTLADKISDIWGVEIDDLMIPRRARAVVQMCQSLPGVSITSADLKSLIDLEELDRRNSELFSILAGAEAERRIIDFSRASQRDIQLALSDIALLLEGLQDLVDEATRRYRNSCTQTDGVDMPDIVTGRIERRVGSLRTTVDAVRQPEIPEQVTFVSVEGGQPGKPDFRVKLNRKLIDPREIFQAIRETVSAQIFTSATLAAGTGERGWSLACREMALDPRQTLTLRVDSPFDFSHQVRGYIPGKGADPQSPAYHEWLAEEIEALIHSTDGGAFILFTSRRDMLAVSTILTRRIGMDYPLLTQGDMARQAMLSAYMADRRSVLMGLKTYWTGVDIAGDALRLLVVTKLPFPSPASAMFQAKSDLCKKEGGNPFMDLCLAYCIRELKQGFGRLIRTMNDVGIFALLDDRMRTKRYAHEIAASLPSFDCDAQIPALPELHHEREAVAA